MKHRYYVFLLAVLLPAISFSQTINLLWLRTDNHGLYNFGNYQHPYYFDRSNNEIVSFVEVGLDTVNYLHGAAINRRSQAGQLLYDTLFDDSAYYNYQVKGFTGVNGETYYCMSYQTWALDFQKLDASGQLVWNIHAPNATFLKAHDWPGNFNSFVLEDTVNNRMLWPYERWNPQVTAKAVGIMATDKTTGALSVVDSIWYPTILSGNPLVYELVRDAANHIYLSSTDHDGKMVISQLNNGNLTVEAQLDSAALPIRPQSIRIIQSTMFVAWQIDLPNGERVNKVNVYSIAANGSLALIRSMNFQSMMSDYCTGIKTHNNYCYVFTSLRQDWTNAAFVPRIWKFDNAGNLVNTFTLSSFTGQCITDLDITDFGIYCSMYSYPFSTCELECIHPVTGQHICSYNLINEFSGVNFGGYHVKSWTQSFIMDEILVSGMSWVNGDLRAQMAKYRNLMPDGINETEAPQFSIYPNPAQETVFISTISSNEYFTAEIYDMTGRIVATQALSGTGSSIPVAALAKGVYMIRVFNGQSSSVQRFTKE